MYPYNGRYLQVRSTLVKRKVCALTQSRIKMTKPRSFDLSSCKQKQKQTNKKNGVDSVYRYAPYALLDAGEFQLY